MSETEAKTIKDKADEIIESFGPCADRFMDFIPGPWETIRDDSGFRVREVNRRFTWIAYVDKADYGPEFAVANARLIAAAPDLLEACQIALAAYRIGGKDTGENSTANALKAAIAKANGQ